MRNEAAAPFCPECGYRHEGTKFCPECGTPQPEREAARTEPAVESPAPTQSVEEHEEAEAVGALEPPNQSSLERRPRLRKPLHLLAGLVYVGLAVPLIAIAGAGRAAQRVGSAVIIAFLLLAVVGTFRFLFSRDPSWPRKTFALGTMAVALVIVPAAAGGRIAQRQSEADEPGSAAAEFGQDPAEVVASGGPTGSREWAEAVERIDREFVRVYSADADFTASISKKWGTARQDDLLVGARGLRTAWAALLSDVEELPANSADEREVNNLLAKAFRLYVAAYDDYVAGIRRADLKAMALGDKQLGLAFDSFLQVQKLVPGLAGEPVDPLHVEYRALGTRLAKLTGPVNRALALDNQFFLQGQDEAVSLEERRATAARARKQYQVVLKDVESIPTPEDDRLATILNKTTKAYRLIVAAYTDYLRAIDQSDDSLLGFGDRKHNKGEALFDKANQEYAAFIRDVVGN